MEESSSAQSSSKKRQASRKPSKTINPLKKEKPNVNLVKYLSKAMGDVIVTGHNEAFRQKCLQKLAAKNGTEAGQIIEDLIVKFKDNKKQKAIKENSEKINGNSP